MHHFLPRADFSCLWLNTLTDMRNIKFEENASAEVMAEEENATHGTSVKERIVVVFVLFL